MSTNKDYNKYDSYLRETIKNKTSFYRQYDIVDIHDNDKILDFGCGPGSFLKYLIKKTPKNVELFGCDINTVAINKNIKNKQLKNVKFKVIAKDRKLPYPNNFFDVVYLLDVIEHTTKPEFMLREINRVLKDSGKLVLNTPDRLSIILDPLFYGKKINVFSFNLKRFLGRAFLDYTHVKEYSFQEMVKMIMSGNFYIFYKNKFTLFYSLPFLHRGSILLILKKEKK